MGVSEVGVVGGRAAHGGGLSEEKKVSGAGLMLHRLLAVARRGVHSTFCHTTWEKQEEMRLLFPAHIQHLTSSYAKTQRSFVHSERCGYKRCERRSRRVRGDGAKDIINASGHCLE